MKRMLFVSAALMFLGLIGAGCGAIHGGKTVVKYEGSNPIVTTVPAAGSYGLYSTTDYNPKVVENLSQNDQIGFRNTDTGQLVGVAGKREIPLETGKTYYWKRQ